MILLVGFVVIALLLIGLGIFFSKRKKRDYNTDIPEELEELRDLVKGKKIAAKKRIAAKRKAAKKTINVKVDARNMGYQGSTPFIELDENLQQMPLDRTKLTIPRETLTRMFPLAYLAGKLSNMDKGKGVGLVMILLFILIIANVAITFYGTSTATNKVEVLANGTTNRMDAMEKKVSDTAVLTTLIAEKLNVTSNVSVPTVGG